MLALLLSLLALAGPPGLASAETAGTGDSSTATASASVAPAATSSGNLSPSADPVVGFADLHSHLLR